MQENVLAESRMMVPDCHKRLEAALTDLKATLVLCRNFYLYMKFSAANLVLSYLNKCLVILSQAELKESNEQGTEIGEAEATITEVEAVYTPTEAED